MTKRQPPQAVRNRLKPWGPSPQQLEICTLVIEGKLTQTEIAQRFGIGQSTVSETCRCIGRWLIPHYMDHIREEKARQTEHLWHIYRETMAGWRRSKENSETVTNVREPMQVIDGEGIRKTRIVIGKTVTKGQCGNPAFLSQARAALADIRKIWGVDAPLEVRHSGEVRVGGLSLEDAIRARIAQLQERLAGLPAASPN